MEPDAEGAPTWRVLRREVGVTGSASPTFGGDWTLQKLDILEKYLDAYTTALKNQPSPDRPFKLVYIDAFAGTGEIDHGLEDDPVSQEDSKSLVMGSAARALDVRDRRFDHLLFVESDPDRCAQLRLLKSKHPSRSVQIVEADANDHLGGLRQGEYGATWRGVLFLDPFGTQVDWRTIEHIARLERLDTWLLFPVGGVGRMLPRSRDPSDVSESWADALTRVYGDESWRRLYSESSQANLFGSSEQEREKGVEGLLGIYKGRLRAVFGSRLLQDSRRLTNSKKSPLFEFIFCAGHPRGQSVAKRIAAHLVWSQPEANTPGRSSQLHDL